MPRNFFFFLVVAVAAFFLLPAIAFAAPVNGKRGEPVKAKRHVSRDNKGYGFLPGYEPRLREDRYRSQSYGFGGPYWPGGRYWYRGRFWYGYGGPGFYQSRWNGGSFGPCWTQTPIGPIWNCGK